MRDQTDEVAARYGAVGGGAVELLASPVAGTIGAYGGSIWKPVATAVASCASAPCTAPALSRHSACILEPLGHAITHAASCSAFCATLSSCATAASGVTALPEKARERAVTFDLSWVRMARREGCSVAAGISRTFEAEEDLIEVRRRDEDWRIRLSALLMAGGRGG